MDDSQTPLSVEHCKNLLMELGKMMCVKAELISMRLLSKEDKQDMLNGNLPLEALVTGVELWINAGMPDYANGNTTPYRSYNGLPMQRYRGLYDNLTSDKFDT